LFPRGRKRTKPAANANAEAGAQALSGPPLASRNSNHDAKGESGERSGGAVQVNADADKEVGSDGDRLTDIEVQRDSATLVEPTVQPPVLSPWAA
jgi:hypothetical protein